MLYVPIAFYASTTLADQVCFSPTSKETLCYGCADGSEWPSSTIKCDEKAHERVAQIATRLNLASHEVGAHKAALTRISSPIDLEVHRVLLPNGEQSLYALDFARLFPPEDPTIRISAGPSSVLTKLLRRELVASSPQALSSDAFSSFSAAASDSAACKQAVNNATIMLRDQRIPQVVAQLLVWLGDPRMGDTRSDIGAYSEQCARFGELLHRAGVNMRHLGLVYERVMHEVSKSTSTSLNLLLELLRVQMCYRVTKDELRKRLRDAVIARPYQVSSWLKVTATFCNEVIYSVALNGGEIHKRLAALAKDKFGCEIEFNVAKLPFGFFWKARS